MIGSLRGLVSWSCSWFVARLSRLVVKLEEEMVRVGLKMELKVGMLYGRGQSTHEVNTWGSLEES